MVSKRVLNNYNKKNFFNYLFIVHPRSLLIFKFFLIFTIIKIKEHAKNAKNNDV